MSYDIELFSPVPGEDPTVTARRDVEIERPLSESARRRNERVVAALRAIEPAIESSERETETEIDWVSGDAAFQIFLGESEGVVNIPYWPRNQAPAVQEKIGVFLLIINRETGFLAFDPQSERLIDVEQWAHLSRPHFSAGLRALGQEDRKRPWWKLW